MKIKKLKTGIKVALLLLILFLVPVSTAHAAIAFDAASSATGVGVSSLTWAHTTSGADRLLIVGVSFDTGTVTGVTYAGVPMTSVGNTTTALKMHMWRLIAPATGANNIVVSFSNTGDRVGGAE